ncbi:STAS domain-containing protein [Streptomyces longwoodensis]|uniref:STAS domain-containing protein n=1 Tax=Streptomyces longwoodensis TaxID=68231 RepID=UPI0037023B52
MAEEPLVGTQHTEPTQPPAGLSVLTAVTGDVHVVTPAGEIDHHTGDDLKRALDEVIDAARPRVVLDMRQIGFMDSSGINILLTAHRAATDTGGWLRLAAPTEAVLRTLQLVGVDTVIDCHPTLDQALTG